MATIAPMIPPKDTTALIAPPVNDIGLLDGVLAPAPDEAAVVEAMGAVVVDGEVAAVDAGAAAVELDITAVVLEVATAAAEVVVLAVLLAAVVVVADAAHAHIALADCCTARPVTAPHPFTTHSSAAEFMAAIEG